MGRDPILEQMFEVSCGFEAPQREPVLPLTHWKTRDGRVLKITEMESEHLRNTILMLRRKLDYIRGPRFDALELEGFRRGIIEPENPDV